ncbi:caspase-2-like isoform X7 [Eriocheir sinensis]|uniref:caspase-2-like isoform X7 n=1 Tax=Eriocheir sinensis TaxID=95602 RepID=UPI0021C6F38A|nr:caspase-2-like isoform X7 [Eriocheir sinensis]
MSKRVQRAITRGVVVRTQSGYRCEVCDKSLTKVEPHLRGMDHFNNLARKALRNPARLPLFLEDIPRVVIEKPAAVILDALLLPSEGLARATRHDPEPQRVLNDGVDERGDGQAFRCRVCDKNLTGAAPCLEHLRSDRHKGRKRTGTQQPLSDFGRLTIRGDQVPGSKFDSLPIGVGRTVDQADGSWVFPWRVMTGLRLFLPSDKVYRNLSVPRGLVLIFNYCFPGHGQHERHGAKRDSFNLQTLFRRMGYLVYLHENKSRSETEQALASTQNDPCLRNYDCLIVFILSHGKDDQIFYTASRREQDCMRLDDVRYRFTDTECPALKGKPKLFFVNFCRTRQISYDGMSRQHSEPRDMMTLYSCINTFRAPRDPELGTFFMQAWCEVLAAHAHDEELSDLHRRVCRRMRDMNASVPELQVYDFKMFYFNPIHAQ